MRLRRLDLVRYGKFTDRTIDFGPKPDDGPDLHIVFGLNEAGKSTALSGFLDLLFGIEERSRYNFLHEYAAMRIGAVLELAGEEHAFTRTKQRNNSLLNAAGQPVSELAIAAHLSGVSRDAYGTMFSLDDETLEAGGRAILESQGDLGKLLFTASAGLGHAIDTLRALEAEADGIYRKQAHGTELALLKKRLADLKTKRDEIDTLASTFETLEAERHDATERYEQSLAERSLLTARLDTIAKYFRAIPILAELGRKSARLAELPDFAVPPQAWSGTVTDMIDDDASLRTRLSANVDEVERVTAKIASVEVDELILLISERIRGLADRKVRYSSAGLDLPSRQTELQILENSVSNCLAALGRGSEPDPAVLLLPAATVGAVRNMIEQRSGIATGARVARDEAAAAADALQAARDRVGEERAVSKSVRARLTAALTKARESEHAKDMRLAREAEDGGTIRWDAAIRRMHPWTGDALALSRIAVPGPSQITGWKAQATELTTSGAVLSARLFEQEASHQTLSARLEALRVSVDVVDDEAASAVRKTRDEAWMRHRKALKGETADEFEILMARNDAVAENRLANARELAEIRTATAALAETASAISRTHDQLSRNDAEMGELILEIRVAAGELLEEAAGSSPQHLIELVEDRVDARSEALSAWQEIEGAHKKAERAAKDLDQVHTELSKALERVGLTPDSGDSLEATMAVAELFLDRQARVDAELAEALKTVASREEDLALRRRAVEMAERREEEWLADIAEVLKGTWLESGVSASGAGSVLDQLAELAKTLQDRDAMRLRIEKMETDRANFIAEVSAIAGEAHHAMEGVEPEQLAIQLAERLERAERSRAARSDLADDLQRLRDERDKLDILIATHERRKDEILGVFGVGSLSEVVEREEALRDRDRLRISIEELEEQLSSELAVEGLAQARAIMDGLDVDSLAVEKAECEQRLFDLDEAIRQQLVRQTRAADKLDAIGGDSAVARIDTERRTVLLEIEEKATRYMQLKIGVMAAGNALRVYRERHRSGMMTRASEAFAMITRGQYAGLATQPGKVGEVLIAMQRDGQSKVADALSKGARFQLYLALRLAGYYEFAQFRSAVPFVADDIMETFDHVRSEEVFKLFAEMSGVGQVIYLTHHRHLCDIAKAVVPGVRIHELE